ncbi:hypothetical protein GCM10010172_82450 [Paractinoplanes ferrugineus]|uniref:Uncharacterized protein n=1 Tax=Paractinoplanes ferrugineus TaxID=113564 RepID=A0A919J4R3_9ACTN|nr:hypothetical protein Afe05nite_24060 [Actinoplanes ferrugineus]
MAADRCGAAVRGRVEAVGAGAGACARVEAVGAGAAVSAGAGADGTVADRVGAGRAVRGVVDADGTGAAVRAGTEDVGPGTVVCPGSEDVGAAVAAGFEADEVGAGVEARGGVAPSAKAAAADTPPMATTATAPAAIARAGVDLRISSSSTVSRVHCRPEGRAGPEKVGGSTVTRDTLAMATISLTGLGSTVWRTTTPCVR